MQKFVLALLQFLEQFSGKHFIYLPKNRKVAGKTAVKTDEDFWYVGDITDTHDLAYGILYNGYVEKEQAGLVKSVLQKMLGSHSSLNFYDIGANTGYYAIMTAFLGSGTINSYAFEPLAEAAWSIEQSARLNRLEEKVKIFRTALSDKSGAATLYLAGSASSLNADFLGLPDAAHKSINTETLDNLAAKQGLPDPDFIKIDVEGHELAVLEGAKKTIEHSKPVMFVAMAKILKNLGGKSFTNPDFEKTFGLLEGMGYKLYCLKGARPLAADPNTEIFGVQMFLCVPGKDLGELKDVISR